MSSVETTSLMRLMKLGRQMKEGNAQLEEKVTFGRTIMMKTDTLFTVVHVQIC
jgi:hypothetical protein